MIGYYNRRQDEYYTYSSNQVTTSTNTCVNVTVETATTIWVSCTDGDQPRFVKPSKPRFVPFIPFYVARYVAPPPPVAWPVALRRFRGDLM